MLSKARRAATLSDLETLIDRYDLCDYLDLKDLHPQFARDFVEALISIMFRYPRLRPKMGYVGSKKGFLSVLQHLALAEPDYVRRFELDGICTRKDLETVAVDGITIIDKINYERTARGNILAQAFSLYGVVDALIVDEEDFGPSGYPRTCNDMKNGSSPQGCDKPISVVYHEIGHLLDYLLSINEDPAFMNYYESFSKDEIRRNVSYYAATNAREFFAEAFAEYMCNPSPRKVARQIGEYIEKKYI
ncbi:MAG: hypothetical protein IJU10_00555 [Clostridia bacterium]|nr:hypothetical protein [Clostridia bacterium]